MNDIKQELLKTVGDVTKQKQHIIVEVERKISEPVKRNTNKLIPIITVAFILLCLALITPQLLQTERQTQTASVPTFDEGLYELELLRQLTYVEGTSFEEDEKMSTASEIGDYLLMKIYAEDHHITISKKDIEEAKKLYSTMQTYTDTETKSFTETNKDILAFYDKHGFGEKDLQHLYENYTYPKLALTMKLTEQFRKDFPKFSQFTHEFIATYKVQQHLIEKDERLYDALLTKYPFTEIRFNLYFDEAIILNVTDTAILYLSSTPSYGDESNMHYVHWAPRLENWAYNVGDVVKIGQQSSYSSTSADVTDVYPNVAHVVKMTPLDQYESVRFTVDEQLLKQYSSSLYWTTSTNKPSTSPHIVITDGVNTYNGYLSTDKGFMTFYHKDKQTKLPIAKATNLLLNVVEGN